MSTHGYGLPIYGHYGVRPALQVSLSSFSLTKVGTVTAEAEQEYRTDALGKPVGTEKPGTTQEPGTTEKPDATGKPSATQAPGTTGQPGSASPTVAPTGSSGFNPSGMAQNPSVSAPPEESHGNRTTKLNIKNKKKYVLSKKLTIQDADGIRSVKLNGKAIKIKAGKKKLSFKLSKYKKWLKKGKWNKLVVTDRKGQKKTVKFKIK